ncbi:MAG: lycopene cyclase domain-containing protein [Chloroflexi bacterium]|nr:lycopene cyclase domain-containing protein [Chloroflexota bacterium]
MFGPYTYLIYQLVWGLPVLALQWAVGYRTLWRRRRLIALAWAIPTSYLAAADRFAIGDGIWSISPDRTIGFAPFGLPFEEALFFALTDLMVVQSFVLFRSDQDLERARLLWRRARALVGSGAPGGVVLGRLQAGYRAGVVWALVGALLATVVAVLRGESSPLWLLASWVMEATPVAAATWLLESLGTLARPLGLLGGLALALVLGGVVGAVARAGRFGPPLALVLLSVVAYLLALRSAAAPTAAFVAGLLPALWPVGASPIPVGPPGRRAFLLEASRYVVGAIALVGLARLDTARRDAIAPEAGASLFDFRPPAPRDPAFPVSGQSPEITELPSFYVMSKNTEDPAHGSEWRLRIVGAVERPLTLSLPELERLSRRDAFVTLQCVSNPVGGSLMSTALFSGVLLAELLELAAPRAEVVRVVFRAPDGHFDGVPLDLARGAEPMLAYAMNGRRLSRSHGFPARVLLPGVYGFKNVKWLDTIELLTAASPGYWQERGWTESAVVKTTARIDVARSEGSGALVAGVAFAGARGIRSVQVRANGGGWHDAQLHQPPLSGLTWVQWRALVPERGDLTLEARAVDGAGQPQSPEERGSYPDGASGYHRVRVTGLG